MDWEEEKGVTEADFLAEQISPIFYSKQYHVDREAVWQGGLGEEDWLWEHEECSSQAEMDNHKVFCTCVS